MKISEEQKRAINALKQIYDFDELCETCYYQGTKRKQIYGCCNCREEAKDIVINLVEKLQKQNKKYKEFFDLMLRLDSDYFMNCGDEGTIKLVDEIEKLESE
jgi:uncharacterized protein YdiU (UPF0061 family)